MGVITTAIGTAILGAGVSATTASIVGGVVIAGAAAGVYSTVQAGKATRKAAEAQTCASNLQAKRQRRSAIRQNILASARSRASAQSAGTAQSSGLAGGVGAGRSQLGAELGFGTQMSGLGAEVAYFQGQAQKANMIAGLGFQAASLAMSPQGTNIINNMSPKPSAPSFKSISGTSIPVGPLY